MSLTITCKRSLSAVVEEYGPILDEVLKFLDIEPSIEDEITATLEKRTLSFYIHTSEYNVLVVFPLEEEGKINAYIRLTSNGKLDKRALRYATVYSIRNAKEGQP